MGGILGGGSSINFMMYTRAQGVDFDSWKTPGWTAADMLPLCKKLETFHQNEEGIDPEKHGYNGPVHISDGGYRGESEMSFLDTIKKMGHKEIVDLQDFDQVGGFSVRVLFEPLISGADNDAEMAAVCLSRRKTPGFCTLLYSPASSRRRPSKFAHPRRIKSHPNNLRRIYSPTCSRCRI